MDQETQNIIKERFATLPDDIKKTVSDANLPEKIENIANKNGLLIDQSGGLLTEVYIVMLGMEKSENFAQNVSKNLGISLNMAIAIAGDVNKEIFLPIRESLMDMSKAKDIIEESAASDEEAQPSERDNIIHDIENPEPATERRAPITDPEREIATRAAAEEFVAAKLTTPPASPAPQNTNPTAQTEKKYSADPYREALN